MNRLTGLLFCCALVVAHPAGAQTSLGGCQTWSVVRERMTRVGEHQFHLAGAVEIECDEVRLMADEMDLRTDADLVTARGNVGLFTEGSQINADRMEFNTRTRTGVFYEAFGIVSLGEQADRSLFGTQEPDAYFWGEEIHRIGPRKYRITRGGFTTCVQPTPRWEVVSGSATITLDDYALLRNPVLKVKGVPLLYVPVLYYPLQEDDRATGFLLPTYGASTLRGQSISNAFFWALDRSQDATFFHDWFTQTGQGFGSEYRYVAAPGSDGTVRAYLLRERATDVTGSGGATDRLPSRQSYLIRGNVNQALPGRLRVRGRVDYPSDIEAQQRYSYNIYDASLRQRLYSVNASGAWGPYLLNSTVDRTEVFYGTTSSTIVGALPRVGFSRSERPVGRSPIYVAVGTEYVTLLRENRAGTSVRDNSLTRVDVLPSVRVPFTRWPFLTVNTSLAWRYTYWTESVDPVLGQTEVGFDRRYFDLQTQIIGPVFTRIWDTPDHGYAQKFKHVIEPSISVQRVSPIDDYERIVRLESTDFVVGDVTRVAYALTNRVYAKPHEGGSSATPREILSVVLAQSYYTDANAAQYDRYYQSNFSGTAPSHFTPIALVVRGQPARSVSGEFRTEYDTQFDAFRTLNASGSFAVGAVQGTAGWSQRRLVEGLPGFNDPTRRDHYVNAAVTVRSPGGRFGGSYAFNYDLFRDYFLQQRLVGYYNAQCCGFGVEYQVYNFLRPDPRTGQSFDRRFNFSFTLAGVGSFSNFFGAFGGNQYPR